MAKSRPTKYGHITPNLPPLPVDPARKAIIEAVKVEILKPPMPEDANLPATTLPELLTEMDAAVSDIIALETRAAAGKPWAAAFAVVWYQLHDVKDKLAEWEKNVNLLLETYHALMVEQMEVEGTTQLKLADGRPVYTRTEVWPTVADPEVFRVWCVKQGFERLMHLHASRTKSLVKEMLVSGQPEPPGIKAYKVTKARRSAGDDE